MCGEDCSIQLCLQCAPEEEKTQIADFILQRTLADIDPDWGSLDELLITIPSCRHTFTVETLDGHCSMSEFYSSGKDGEWNGLLTPIGFRRPPTCPTCRSEINAPRYGRAFKRANLDILERNVAAKMSLSLATVQTFFESISVSTKKAFLVSAAEAIKLDFQGKMDNKRRAQAKAQQRVLSIPQEMPIAELYIKPANTDLFAIDPAVVDIWGKAMHELLTAYRQVVQVTETRSAHTDAWEAALSALHESEVNAALTDPGTAPRDPMIHAMRVAKIKIGQPRPLADRRFLVESIWLTIHIRLALTELTTAWIEAIGKRPASSAKNNQQLAWATYTRYLFKSCLRDADVAFVVAENSESHRQLSKTALYQMRIALEKFRFDLMMCKMTGQFKVKENRDMLAENASELRQKAEALMNATIYGHLRKKRSQEERTWLETNFSSVARDIVEDWTNIERSIRMDTFYEPLSLNERIAIVKAMGFGKQLRFRKTTVDGRVAAHAGHYYNCPNGHTFVITEVSG